MLKSSSFKPVYMAITALLAWFALTLQFYLQLKAAHTEGRPVFMSAGNFFSYFTILTNLLIALCFTFILLSPVSKAGRFFSRATVQSGIALYIGIVGLVYSLALREIWDPQGWQLVADRMLHDIIPILYLLYWLLFVPKGLLRPKNALWWLIYPLIYIIYTTIRGAVYGWYPYPFIDAGKLGYSQALRNAGMLLIAFIGIGLLLVGIDRLLKKI